MNFLLKITMELDKNDAETIKRLFSVAFLSSINMTNETLRNLLKRRPFVLSLSGV